MELTDAEYRGLWNSLQGQENHVCTRQVGAGGGKGRWDWRRTGGSWRKARRDRRRRQACTYRVMPDARSTKSLLLPTKFVVHCCWVLARQLVVCLPGMRLEPVGSFLRSVPLAQSCSQPAPPTPLATQCQFKQVFGNMFFCVSSGQAHVCDQVGGIWRSSGRHRQVAPRLCGLLAADLRGPPPPFCHASPPASCPTSAPLLPELQPAHLLRQPHRHLPPVAPPVPSAGGRHGRCAQVR